MLIQPLPFGYRLVFKDERYDAKTYQMVPNGQSMVTWTDIVSTNIIFGLAHVDLGDYQSRVAGSWRRACPTAKVGEARQGVANGYPYLLWTMECDARPETDLPETAISKAIKGVEAMYVVQKTFRYRPTRGQINAWSGYLDSVRLCDDRLPDRLCPP